MIMQARRHTQQHRVTIVWPNNDEITAATGYTTVHWGMEGAYTRDTIACGDLRLGMDTMTVAHV